MNPNSGRGAGFERSQELERLGLDQQGSRRWPLSSELSVLLLFHFQLAAASTLLQWLVGSAPSSCLLLAMGHRWLQNPPRWPRHLVEILLLAGEPLGLRLPAGFSIGIGIGAASVDML